ncbi:isoaspartyl peptidase/L-asparaginase family protein [Mixta intestinalis]|uniref:Isoaspartyl peptidase n=1 Tax=Mixta intestinalis TaxID=1615494 RepID=A0A6P1PWM8_9GAMM|nr:isoaspartyl peptidase/L-asparaginase [Mixta intestinalis]QHM70407.1 Isoaspartyl peptidase [Mixta intestinalis]
MGKAGIAIHGGAGAIARASLSMEQEQRYLQALTGIVASGQAILAAGGSALDAVTEAVRLLEESPLFNAGKGSVFTCRGTHELDACIMDGHTQDAGAVAGVAHIRNPVLAARKVLENSPHVLLSGDGAEQFAREQGLELVAADFFSTDERWQQLQRAQATQQTLLDHDGAAQSAPLDADRKLGTVGAVACDSNGHLAAATSTGGMTNKQPGRVGDSPLPGAGCFSNRRVAVSCTGTGEVFIRTLAAYDVAALMEYSGYTLRQACAHVIHDKIASLDGSGGLIAIDADGNMALPFNTEGMYRGYGYLGESPVVAIYRTR